MEGLKQDIKDALYDATDLDTGVVDSTYFNCLIDNLLIEQLNKNDVIRQSELLFNLLRFAMSEVFTDFALKNIVKQFENQIK